MVPTSLLDGVYHPYALEEERVLRDFLGRCVDLRSDAGRAIRDSVIEGLQRISGEHGFPLVLAGTSFGAGSFGRRTMAQPLDDIDIYLVLNAGGCRSFMKEPPTSSKVLPRAPSPMTLPFTLIGGYQQIVFLRGLPATYQRSR